MYTMRMCVQVIVPILHKYLGAQYDNMYVVAIQTRCILHNENVHAPQE